MTSSCAVLGGFVRCYDNIHVCNFIALYTANAYSAVREMSASACTRSVPGYFVVDLLYNLLLTVVITPHPDVANLLSNCRLSWACCRFVVQQLPKQIRIHSTIKSK